MSQSKLPKTPSRRDYTDDPSYQAQAARNATPLSHIEDPLALFRTWMDEARAHEINDANAMSLATVDAAGHADVRIVLLKDYDASGFVFYSNRDSRKGQELAVNPYAALCFHWKSLRRQVRIRGPVSLVDDKIADTYYGARARGSQIGAWASDQSRPVDSRKALKARVSAANIRFEGVDNLPRPPFWGGWRVRPDVIEFWRDQPFRLHDRLHFTKTKNGWDKCRLFP